MTTESDVRKLKGLMTDLAGAVEQLAQVVERIAKDMATNTDGGTASRVARTARTVKNSY
jgi:hypothetical protein